MLQLKDCKEQHQYRRREDSETELITVLLPKSDPFQHSLRVRLASLKSKYTAKIRFHNLFDGQVRAVWMDFDGHEVAYSTLNPGEDRLYLTYHNHCWIFRELVTGRRMNIGKCQAVFAKKDFTQKVCIQAPPLLTWQDSHHVGFPEAFRLSTKMLLFCHNSLSKQMQVDPCDLPMHSCMENRDNNLPEIDGKQASCNAMLPDRKRSHADSLKTWDDMKRSPCLKLPAPLLQSNLGCIPMHILQDIVQLTAPTDVWQDAGCLGACPDILPALAPCGVIAQVFDDST